MPPEQSRSQVMPEAARPKDGMGFEDLRVALFVRMWAAAHIVHLAGATDSRLDTAWNVTVVLAALMLLRFPDRGSWLAILAAAQLVDLVVEMPVSPDHWILIGTVNAAILATMAWRRAWDGAAIAAAFPAARQLLLVAYSAAALAKYNTTFLDPITSCATEIAGTASYGLTDFMGASPAWLIATIGMETALPILLAIPATRRHGVRLGMAFHFVLSISPAFAVVDFTATLFALFLLFLPSTDVEYFHGRLAALSMRSAIARDVRQAPLAAASMVFMAFGLLGYLSVRVSSGIVFVVAEMYLVVLLVVAVRTWRPTHGRRPQPLGRLAWVHMPVVVVLVLWAASPYVGLRTTSVFTMFSGLRTEGTQPNHLFMPTFRLVKWQDEFFVIQQSNDPEHASIQGGKVGVPLMLLRRSATDDPDLTVSGALNGTPVTFGPDDSHTAFEPLSGWRYKFLHFRPVGVNGEPFCSIS
jgi:hypothetical protein